MIASAILHLLVDHATTINIKGESYRLKEKRRPSLLRTATEPAEQSTGRELQTSDTRETRQSLDRGSAYCSLDRPETEGSRTLVLHDGRLQVATER